MTTNVKIRIATKGSQTREWIKADPILSPPDAESLDSGINMPESRRNSLGDLGRGQDRIRLGMDDGTI
jgi:hypothetical protein